jgi:hypothetical protein
MQNSFIILVSVLLLHGGFHTKENQYNKAFNKTFEWGDTSNPELIFGCILEIEAKPDQKEWADFLQSSLQLDSISVDSIPAGIFTVIAQFVIDRNGNLKDVSIIKDPGYGLGKRVKKSLDNYKSSWEPAKLNGHPTFSYRRQSITFLVEEENDEKCEEQLPGELIL